MENLSGARQGERKVPGSAALALCQSHSPSLFKQLSCELGLEEVQAPDGCKELAEVRPDTGRA